MGEVVCEEMNWEIKVERRRKGREGERDALL